MKLRLLPFLGALFAALLSPVSAVLPVQNEQIVVTCFSGSYSGYTTGAAAFPNFGPTGFVVAQFNTTTGTIGPILPGLAAPPVVWTGPASVGNHNENNPGLEWNRSKLGEVFGICLDDLSPPNIYVAASDCYNVLGSSSSLNATSPFGPGGIHRLDANNGAILSGGLPAIGGSTPASGPGLGNLCFYRAANGTPYLYVSNLEDGNIYRVNPATMAAAGSPYDHGVQGRPQESLTVLPDNSQPGLTPYGRRIWGVKTYQNRLFYAVWWEDGRNVNPAESNEIWSVDLDSAGNFLPLTARRRITLPDYPDTSGGFWSYPVSSIDFSPSGAMFLAERYWQLNPITGNATSAFGPHYCRLHRYTLSGPTWITTPTATHLVGGNATPYFYVPPYAIVGANSAGGMAVNCDESIWTTGDMFNGYSPNDSTTNLPLPAGSYLYGALRIQPGGNTGLPAGHGGLVVDYDGTYGISKVAIGAVATRRECCMTLATSNILCPATPGGSYTFDLTINNLLAVPISQLQFTPVPLNQLPPGATSFTPSPASLTLGSPIPANGTGTISLAIPNIPPVGGKVCFNVSVLSPPTAGGESHVLCTLQVCVDFPKCPCALLTASNLQCPPCLNQPHTLNLTMQNIWSSPYYWYSLAPCPPAELPPGTINVVPSPAGLQSLAPLLPNSSVTVPVALQGVPLSGGVACFVVRFYDSQENVLLCEEKICVNFPACNPSPGMTLTQVGPILCPQYPGGPFKLTFTITNTQPLPASGATFAACSGPAGGNFFGVSPGTVTFSPPLAQGQSSTVTVCLTGLSSGEMACLCVQFLDEQHRPFCGETLCFTMPPCPQGDPPCLRLDAVNIKCPTNGTGYTFALNLTNNSGTTATFYQLSPVPMINLPVGAVTSQPSPAGLQPFASPVPGTGGTAVISGIQLPLNVPDGANYCFVVKLFNANDQVICSQLFCVQLPRCACARATADVACVAPFPNRQVTFNVTNNTNAVGVPFNFTQAVIIPATGFSPSTMIPSPNPIVPGGSGTFTSIFTGPRPPLCVMLLLFNENRTRCCRVRVCPLWVECDPGPPKDHCDLPSQVSSEASGIANYTAWITNNSPTQTKLYQWTLTPMVAPGCTGTLPGNAFTPPTGTTVLVAPGSSQGVSFTVNATSLSVGACAGFKICFSEVTPQYVEAVCCPSIVRRIGPTDPCVILNPTARAIPMVAGDLDILIKNPASVPLNMDVLVFDTSGGTTYSFDGAVSPAQVGEISGRVSAAAGESVPLLLRANIAAGPGSDGTPVVIDPALVELIWIRLCNNSQGYEILGSQIHFRPGGNAPFIFPPPGIRVLPTGEVSYSKTTQPPIMHFTVPSEPGFEYQAFSDTNLKRLGTLGGTRILPHPGYRMLQAGDGTFLGKDGIIYLDLPGSSGVSREFFKVKSPAPKFNAP